MRRILAGLVLAVAGCARIQVQVLRAPGRQPGIISYSLDQVDQVKAHAAGEERIRSLCGSGYRILTERDLVGNPRAVQEVYDFRPRVVVDHDHLIEFECR